MSSFGAPRYVYESIPSTMDRLTELALQGASEGTIVVAAEQTSGRGRAGRAWSAPAGSALLFSLLLRPRRQLQDLAVFPLIAGVAIAEGIESVGGDDLAGSVGLKWPNDLLLGERKLAGILMQTRSVANGDPFINLGVGLNVNADRAHLPSGATSLRDFTGRDWSIPDLEGRVLEATNRRYREFLDRGSEPGRLAWLDRACYLGQDVVVKQDGEIVTGRLDGITASGALVISTGHGPVEIVAGDLARGPRPI